MNVTMNVPVLVVSALSGFTRTRMMSRSHPRHRHRPDILKRSRSHSVRYARSNYTDGGASRRVQANSSWDSAYTQTESQILPRQQASGPNSLGSAPNWSALVSGTALWMLSPSMVQGVAGAKVCATDEESGNVTCHERLSPGVIAAIVVSSVLVFLLLVGVAFFIHRTRQRRQEAVRSAKWVFGHHQQNKYDVFERPELGYGGWSFNPGNKSSGGNPRPSHDVASSKIWSAPGTARSINEKHTASVMGSGTAVGSGGTRMGTGIGTGKTNQTQTGSARSGGPWSAALAWRGFRNWSWMTRSAPGDKANFHIDPYTYGQEYGGRSGASSGQSGGKFEEIDIHSGGVNGNGHGNGRQGDDEKFMSVESSQIEGPKGWEGRYERFHLSLGLASAPLAGGGKNAWSGGRGSSLRRTRDRESERNAGNGSRNDAQTKSTSANGTRHGTSSLSRTTSKSAGVVKQSTSAGASVVSRSSQSTRNAYNDGRSEGRHRSKSRGERDKPVQAPVSSTPINLTLSREPSGSQSRSQGSQKAQGRSLTIQPSISAHNVPPQLSSAVAIAQAAVRRAEMSPHVYNGSGSASSSRKPLQLKHLPNVTSTVLSGPGSATLPAIPAPSSPLVASVTATDLDHPPRSQRLPPLPPTPSIPPPISPLPEKDEKKPVTEARKEDTREQYEIGYF